MPKKRNLNIYKNYTDNDFSQAIQAVKNGMSQRKAAKYYSVPQGTLSDHLRGRVIDGTPAGRKPVLSAHTENQIAQKCGQAAEMGLGMSRNQVLEKVGTLTKEMKLKNPFTKSVPGKDWWYGFKTRNPNITLRAPEKLTSIRARGLNSLKVGDYFKDLKKVITDLGLEDKPECIWNMDEKGVSLEHKPVKVVAVKSSRCTPGRVANTRESNTVIASINAAGTWMPPLIIVKGKTEKSVLSYNTNDGPIGAKWTYQMNAWTNDILGAEWFTNIFLKECGQHRPQLLILDGHHSHEVLGLIEKAVENDIHILAFPSHTTHFLCPLDRCVFGPFSSKYNKLCSEYCQTPGNIVNKISWPGLFTKAFLASFTHENIVSGFRSCGIAPWNPLSIPSSAFSPSLAFDHHDTQVNQGTHGEHPLKWILKEPSVPQATPQATANVNTQPLMQVNDNSNKQVQFVTGNTETDSEILLDSNSDVPGSPSDPRLMSDMSASVLLPVVDDETRDAIETLISLDQNASGKVLYEVSLNTSDLESGTYDLGHIDIDINTSDTTTIAQDENKRPNWDSSVDTIFSVQPPPPKKSKSSTKNTSHRLLTAHDIIEQKREKAEIKEKKEAAKQKRHKIKELMAAKKLIESELKGVRADVSALKD